MNRVIELPAGHAALGSVFVTASLAIKGATNLFFLSSLCREVTGLNSSH